MANSWRLSMLSLITIQRVSSFRSRLKYALNINEASGWDRICPEMKRYKTSEKKGENSCFFDHKDFPRAMIWLVKL
jgi:hypothetical protein